MCCPQRAAGIECLLPSEDREKQEEEEEEEEEESLFRG
jgi:hypothetical protein